MPETRQEMTALHDMPLLPHPEPAVRKKPCIALMGEFSAGKSTLSNLLIGQSPLPVKVTATHLPPVRISHGTAPAWRTDHDGNVLPVDLERLTELSPADTKLIQLYLEADLLELCDLIDMPGISDPNMAWDVFEGVIDAVDGVIWCTHATQAWRQSEAAVWEDLAGRLAASSLLLLTRFDKLLCDEDKARVLRRIRNETEGLFAGIHPISLTEAVEGRNDWELWQNSGAEAFSQAFVDLLNGLQGREAPDTDDTETLVGTIIRSTAAAPDPRPAPETRLPSDPDTANPHPSADAPAFARDRAVPDDLPAPIPGPEPEAVAAAMPSGDEVTPADPAAIRPRRVLLDGARSRSNRPLGASARPFSRL